MSIFSLNFAKEEFFSIVKKISIFLNSKKNNGNKETI